MRMPWCALYENKKECARTLSLLNRLHHFFVHCGVLALQIREMATTVGNHAKKTATRVYVVAVFLQMTRQLGNLFVEHPDLHFR